MSSQHFQHVIDIGRGARIAATKVRNSLFPGWRQRRFRRHLGRFIVALEHMPQREAATLSAVDLSTLGDLINNVIAGAETFMAEHHDSTTSEIGQDRFVVTEIYQLRAIAESLTRHVTADPALMDVGWTVRTQAGNRPKE